MRASLALTSLTTACHSGSSRRKELALALALVYASASVRAATRSVDASAGVPFTACSSITAPLIVEIPASAESPLCVSIWTERAASLYTSHNFWCAAATSAAVEVGGADVAGRAVVPLVVGRVNATIKAAAPSVMAMAKPTACQTREPVPGCLGWVCVHWPVVGGRVVT